MEFVKLNEYSESEILEAHNEAFSDYEIPMHISLDSFKYLNLRRGVRYDLSLGAVSEEKLVGFIINAIDTWEGKLTAYDCGTGVIPSFRERGIGNQIFSELVPLLQKEKVEQYLLEVIQSNTAAYNLYKKRNFEISREFNCLSAEVKELNFKIQDSNLGEGYSIQRVNSINWKVFTRYRDYPPSWQNSDLSIQRVPNSFRYLEASFKNKLVGYLVYEPNGGITQIGIDPNHRNQNISTEFIKHILENEENLERMHIINIDKRDSELQRFLSRIGFKSFTTQFEMILKI
jgi:ribosomal protein S18 acetylase RimI-like enzyme